MPWDRRREVTFECEPGTLQQHKLETLERTRRHPPEPRRRELRATRSSSTTAGPISKTRSTAPTAGPATSASTQINIDLIAGMVGETWDNWKDCVAKTIELAPDSVTIYQMELPFNTVFSKELKVHRPGRAGDLRRSPTGRPSGPGSITPSTSWRKAGYEVSSAYTLVKDKAQDASSSTATASGTGPTCSAPASPRSATSTAFTSRTSTRWEAVHRACSTGASCRWAGRCRSTPRERLIREMILQLKTGRLDATYFRREVRRRTSATSSRTASRKLEASGWLNVTADGVELTPDGLLQIDRHLPAFFEPQYRSARYT